MPRATRSSSWSATTTPRPSRRCPTRSRRSAGSRRAPARGSRRSRSSSPRSPSRAASSSARWCRANTGRSCAGRPTVVSWAPLGVTAAVRGNTEGVSAPEAGVIVNERFRVEVAEDASFTIIDRVTDTKSARMNVLIDEGDRGDEYTYSYAGPTIGSKGLAGRRSTRVDGDRALVTVDIVLRLPASLRDDRLARRPDLVDERVRFVISLDASAAHVDVSATVTNAAPDHRLQVVCETRLRT